MWKPKARPFPCIILYLLVCRFASPFRQIKVLQREISLYVCCLRCLISFTVTADQPNITGLRSAFPLRTVSVDISPGKLHHRLRMARDSHLDTHFPCPFALLRSETYRPVSGHWTFAGTCRYPVFGSRYLLILGEQLL